MPRRFEKFSQPLRQSFFFFLALLIYLHIIVFNLSSWWRSISIAIVMLVMESGASKQPKLTVLSLQFGDLTFTIWKLNFIVGLG